MLPAVTAQSNPVNRLASEEEWQLVQALRVGDEAAYAALIERYHASLVRLAMLYVADRATAEEVAQETWLGVLEGLPRFEGRAALKTWIFRILTNRAKTRGQRESRSIPFSAFGDPADEPAEPAVSPDRFRPADDPVSPRHWAVKPAAWNEIPEERFLAQETLSHIQRAIEALPPNQREVITLRDIEGWTAEEVCNALEISETNQRVLLHRARAKVRRALEDYFEEGQ